MVSDLIRSLLTHIIQVFIVEKRQRIKAQSRSSQGSYLGMDSWQAVRGNSGGGARLVASEVSRNCEHTHFSFRLI